jgi:hypothetical protein
VGVGMACDYMHTRTHIHTHTGSAHTHRQRTHTGSTHNHTGTRTYLRKLLLVGKLSGYSGVPVVNIAEGIIWVQDQKNVRMGKPPLLELDTTNLREGGMVSCISSVE